MDVLANLDASKATGPDKIPSRVLKETAHELAPSLCEQINKSLRLGSVLVDRKLANVVSIFKKDNKEHAENYRPNSLLCVVSEVMEPCVFNSIKDRVYCLVERSQRVFITGRSCMTQFVEVLDFIGSPLDNGEQVDVISFICRRPSKKLVIANYSGSCVTKVFAESF